jgi:8-oxo-dGTP pyrophosphatase MutT (NUDIX family)
MTSADPFISAIRKRLNHADFSLPATESNTRMAAVLVPLIHKEGEWQLLFTRRSAELVEHSGEVSFPGGSVEKEDHDFVQTALRETWEEVGIPASKIEILGDLKLFQTVSNYCLKPVVGVVDWPLPLTLNPPEVERAFSIPLAWLADRANWREVLWQSRNGEMVPVVIYEPFDGEKLWGITARIAQEFLTRIQKMPE